MAQAIKEIGYDELAALKLVALDGALEGRTTVTCSALADRLGASNQTASRRLQRLERAGLLERAMTGDGQRVAVTEDGERTLQREYASYRRLFEDDADVELSGVIVSGMGEGHHYISLPGYMEQFRERLGYEPFPGTLNVELDDESARTRGRMSVLDPIGIDGWENEERTYGPAYCWPATIRTSSGDRYENSHVIAPERTHHGDEHLEVLAPDELRAELNLGDGDHITIHVTEQ